MIMWLQIARRRSSGIDLYFKLVLYFMFRLPVCLKVYEDFEAGEDYCEGVH